MRTYQTLVQRTRDLGSNIRTVAKSNNCQVVKTYSGRGIGNLFHTSPNIPQYDKNKAVDVMNEGRIFTVEPMINVGTWEDATQHDNWTAITRDGRRSAQFERTVLVTATGCEILTDRENEPVMVWDVATNQPWK